MNGVVTEGALRESPEFSAEIFASSVQGDGNATIPMDEPQIADRMRLPVLDGWRGLSILAVLGAHLSPLGPKTLHFNAAAGMFGMAIFFTLSGFLITYSLLEQPKVVDFLTKRFFRILPLAWLCMAIAFAMHPASIGMLMSHFLFYANLPPQQLIPVTAHMWSLCVEVQFYVFIALLVALRGRAGLLLIPVLCLGHTALRIAYGVQASSVTYYRVDEILAGCVLALALHGEFGKQAERFVAWFNPFLLLALFVLACMVQSGPLNYVRPYFAAMLVGATIVRSSGVLPRLLHTKALLYLAAISYALYVIHPLLADTWLGSGDVIEKYAKRPLLFIVLFALAHLSTFYFERPCIFFSKHLVKRWRQS
ncbi:MAG: Peptidoglycan/LPS O-acetylase OafA/YrhL, contains acyltransferase and SGNH-hydrolase domain [Rhodocyclales bacterium]|nr:Peptidoglycan/LPS O-acetylase OafA/YrhL, contains acyltransferase and SGNH-hydrolase domain [Rhodocyclales bacterium]